MSNRRVGLSRTIAANEPGRPHRLASFSLRRGVGERFSDDRVVEAAERVLQSCQARP